MELKFTQTIREHKGTIYTVCYMFSNNPQEVADLFQEILINLWKGFSKFRGDSNVRTWIYRVSLNTCISSERKKSRNKDTLPLKMDINLFDDSDEDSKQVQMLRARISNSAMSASLMAVLETSTFCKDYKMSVRSIVR